MRKIILVAFVLPSSLLLYGACGGDDTGVNGKPDSSVTPDGMNLPDKTKPPADVQDMSDTAPPCAPGDVSSYMPTWVPPVSANACSDVQISDWNAKCYGAMANMTNCQAWIKANMTCYNCLETPASAMKYGALIQRMGYVIINVAGCDAIVLGDLSATGCAAKVQALTGCESASCDPTCSSDIPSLNGCFTNADKTTCKSYATAAACIMSADGGMADSGATLDVCNGVGASDFASYAAMVAPVFCGGHPASTPDSGISDASDGGG